MEGLKERKRVLINGLSARQGGGITYLNQLICDQYLPNDIEVDLIINNESLGKVVTNSKTNIILSDFASKSIFHRLLWENTILVYLLLLKAYDYVLFPAGIRPFCLPKRTKVVSVCQNMLLFDDFHLKRFSHKMRCKFKILKWLQIYTFNRSHLVVFISKFAQQEVSKRLKKINSTVIYHGVCDSFKYKSESQGLQKILPYDYALYVSHLYNYKAHLEVVRSWHHYKKNSSSPLKLVFLGFSKTPYGEQVVTLIKELGLEQEVLLLGEVEHDVVYDYYCQAKLIIFASGCENCPNILLESMASGVPILCSNHGPMPEIALDTVFYFDPYRIDELERLLTQYDDDPQVFEERGTRSKEHSKKYSWKSSIGSLWQTVLNI